eukprot:12920687-Prorocentrum_lima.AAC.1
MSLPPCACAAITRNTWSMGPARAFSQVLRLPLDEKGGQGGPVTLCPLRGSFQVAWPKCPRVLVPSG